MKCNIIIILLTIFFSITVHATSQTDMLHGKTFYIQASQPYEQGLNKGYWDIKGNNPIYKNGQNLIVWAKDNGDDRKFKFLKDPKNPGYYVIIPLHGEKQHARVDVAGGKKANGANIILWKMNGRDNQKFRVDFTSTGYARIFNKNGMILSLEGRRYENGSNIHTWVNHNGHQTEWALIDVNTGSRFIPNNGAIGYETVKKGNEVYTLQTGEEFVFGKIGLNTEGDQKYTLVVVRKSNLNKEFYAFYGNYYAEHPLNANLRKLSNAPDYDKYDYYLIFNGKKFGPYDHIFALPNRVSEVDQWVSEDGKYISFVGTNGNKWNSILHNNKALSSWEVGGIQNYDCMGDKCAYPMYWAKNMYKLFEQGRETFQNAKMIEAPRYSKQGKLLYIADADDGKYIYLNHKKIDGPFRQISNLIYGYQAIGFVPNTEKVYYNTFTKAKIGNKEYVCKKDEIVGRFKISEDVISFVVLNKITRINTLYEYDNKTGEMIPLGTYNGDTSIINFDKSLYYVNVDRENSQYSVIGRGGKELWKKNYSAKDLETPDARMSPFGDLYTWYKSNGIWTIEKNSKKIAFNGKIAGINPITFNPVSGEALIHAKIDKNIGNSKHHIYYGKLNFEVSGDLNGGKLFPTDDGKSVFYTLRTIQDNIWTYKLYKNGQSINNNVYANISDFKTTPSGDNYAMLVADKQKVSYIILNECLDVNWKMVFNGKELTGKYGAPVWSKQKNAIIAMKQVGNNIVIEKLH